MTQAIDMMEAIDKNGIAAKGRGELIKHLNGERLTGRQACLAKCYECMGYYSDGKQDCKIPTCPLYMYMPYRETPDSRSKSRGKKN